MGLSFGAPTDPAYIRFLEGLKQVAADPAGKVAWKWHPKDGKWYSYEVAKWVMEDRGIPDTPPDGVLQSQGFPTVTWKVQEIWAPKLFERLQTAHAEFARRQPGMNLVWSALGGGTWRNAFERTNGHDGDDEGDGDGDGLPPECVKRIKRVRLFQRGGYITAEEAQRQINAIVDECT